MLAPDSRETALLWVFCMARGGANPAPALHERFANQLSKRSVAYFGNERRREIPIVFSIARRATGTSRNRLIRLGMQQPSLPNKSTLLKIRSRIGRPCRRQRA